MSARCARLAAHAPASCVLAACSLGNPRHMWYPPLRGAWTLQEVHPDTHRFWLHSKHSLLYRTSSVPQMGSKIFVQPFLRS